MKTAIEITEQEIKWHEENRSEAPTSAHADVFIKGLKHLLALFKQAHASQQAVQADAVCCSNRALRCTELTCDKCGHVFHE